jgi:beta-mannosidase
VLNETDVAFAGTVEVALLRDGHAIVAQASARCEVPPRAAATFASDALLGAFYDTAYAYRFGPPMHDVLVATLAADGAVLSEAFHFPLASEPKQAAGAAVAAEMRPSDSGGWEAILRSDRFLYAAHLDVPGLIAEDDYFHLVPGREKRVALAARSGGIASPRGFLEAVNLGEPVRITLRE